MRTLVALFFVGFSLVAQADIRADQHDALCKAAVTEAALAPLVEQLVIDNKMKFGDASLMLSVNCNGQSLLSLMVNKMLPENLEYAVIDMGLDVDSPVVLHQGNHLSVSDYLRQVIAEGQSDKVAFASEYLKDFHDPAFNPNLILRLSAR